MDHTEAEELLWKRSIEDNHAFDKILPQRRSKRTIWDVLVEDGINVACFLAPLAAIHIVAWYG